MSPQNLTHIVTNDLCGITRGRPVTEEGLAAAFSKGVGWVPANICLTPFNGIADPNPWGSKGDLRLVPERNAVFTTELFDGATSLAIAPASIIESDGSQWSACARTCLQEAVEDLKRKTGLSLLCATEHEFTLVHKDGNRQFPRPPEHAFSIGALRAHEPFATRLIACLEEAGIEPEMVLAEFGDDQFEITHKPSPALQAADRVVAMREIIRQVARLHGLRACLSPKPAQLVVGNGVHIHFSLWQGGVNVSHGGNGAMSPRMGTFCAGLLRDMKAIVALSAPSPISYARLTPHSWSASWTWLAVQDREASLRICPGSTAQGVGTDPSFNVEFRACDGTSNPYLVLSALIRSGLAALEEDLPPAVPLESDPSEMSDTERDKHALSRLPQSLTEALGDMTDNKRIGQWMHPDLLASVLAVKEAETERVNGLEPDALCRAYAERY